MTTTTYSPPSVSHSGGASIPILAVAAFVIVTTEFLIVGLLPALARDLGIAVSTAGQLVTLFAVVVMICGPFLTAWLANVNRKRLFVAILVLFAASNGLAAIAPNIWVLAIARLLPALALPVFWGTASETAAQIAGPGNSGKAVSTFPGTAKNMFDLTLTGTALQNSYCDMEGKSAQVFKAAITFSNTSQDSTPFYRRALTFFGTVIGGWSIGELLRD